MKLKYSDPDFIPVFYDFQYISLVLARTNMAETPQKKLVPKSRSIEYDTNKWINNRPYSTST